MKMCEEMSKLREMLTERGIEWEDRSSVDTIEDIEKKKRYLIGIPESYYDTSMYRTHFNYNGIHCSVINGYGSYGGYNPYTGENMGLLELMINRNEPEGCLTAEQVIEMIYNLKKV